MTFSDPKNDPEVCPEHPDYYNYLRKQCTFEGCSWDMNVEEEKAEVIVENVRLSEQHIANTNTVVSSTAHLNPASLIRVACGEPAPLVVNGGGFAMCSQDKGHAESHSITVTWGEHGLRSL